jgi:hypothetical protein
MSFLVHNTVNEIAINNWGGAYTRFVWKHQQIAQVAAWLRLHDP